MKLSRELAEALEQKLGQKPTENRIRRWLQSLDAGQSPSPSSVVTPAESTSPALSGENLEKARAVIKQASQRLPVLAKPAVGSLEEAALILIGVMEQAHIDMVKETALDMGYPVWVIMLAAVSRAADHRELSALDVSPDWLNEPGKIVPPPKVVTCQFEGCGLEIPGARRGQSACCNAHGSGKAEHSPGCPAAVAAGLDVSPKAPDAPAVDVPKPAAPLAATGTCQRCHLPIIGGRPGAIFCCNAHGSDQDRHSDGCQTGALATQDAPQA